MKPSSSWDAEGRWTAQRLRSLLQSRYRHERIIALANREPFTTERAPDGRVDIKRSAGGVVTALEPILQSCAGVWVAHGSDDALGSSAPVRPRFGGLSRGYRVRRVMLDARERRGHYDGFSNEGLWPLCHRTPVRPVFTRDDYDRYCAVNARFAAAVRDEAQSASPLVLVQDYHFALVPARLRAHLPRSTIVTFWHVPWPEPVRFETCPWANQLLEGLLGSTVVGFQTSEDCHNFIDVVERRLGAGIDRAEQLVTFRNRHVIVRPYPISVEWPMAALRHVPSPRVCQAAVRSELGLAPDTVLGVGVDRVDYIKGLEEKFLAIERLLEQRPDLRGRFAFAQLAQPSRESLPTYRELRSRLREIVGRINDRFAAGGNGPIVLVEGHHEPECVLRFLRAADVCYVGSLHDGMNLVAKEFVAARSDERGVLLLSRFAGATHQLKGAVAIDPHDCEGSANALATALQMPPLEQARRMRAMRHHVREFNVYRWAATMLSDAASAHARDGSVRPLAANTA